MVSYTCEDGKSTLELEVKNSEKISIGSIVFQPKCVNPNPGTLVVLSILICANGCDIRGSLPHNCLLVILKGAHSS